MPTIWLDQLKVLAPNRFNTPPPSLEQFALHIERVIINYFTAMWYGREKAEEVESWEIGVEIEKVSKKIKGGMIESVYIFKTIKGDEMVIIKNRKGVEDDIQTDFIYNTLRSEVLEFFIK